MNLSKFTDFKYTGKDINSLMYMGNKLWERTKSLEIAKGITLVSSDTIGHTGYNPEWKCDGSVVRGLVVDPDGYNIHQVTIDIATNTESVNTLISNGVSHPYNMGTIDGKVYVMTYNGIYNISDDILIPIDGGTSDDYIRNTCVGYSIGANFAITSKYLIIFEKENINYSSYLSISKYDRATFNFISKTSYEHSSMLTSNLYLYISYISDDYIMLQHPARSSSGGYLYGIRYSIADDTVTKFTLSDSILTAYNVVENSIDLGNGKFMIYSPYYNSSNVIQTRRFIITDVVNMTREIKTMYNMNTPTNNFNAILVYIDDDTIYSYISGCIVKHNINCSVYQVLFQFKLFFGAKYSDNYIEVKIIPKFRVCENNYLIVDILDGKRFTYIVDLRKYMED